MQDLSKLTKAQLMEALTTAIAAANVETKPARKARKGKTTKAKGKRAHTANVTEAFSLTRDPRSDEFGVEYGVLEFLDGNDKPHTGALREDDTLGQELIAEIKSYAHENAVGRSKIRYNRKLNAWTGRMDMFPARLRKLAGIA